MRPKRNNFGRITFCGKAEMPTAYFDLSKNLYYI